MKFGIESTFNIVYICHKDCFPTLFQSTSLGYCNFICRVFTAFSPMLARVSPFASTAVFTTSCLIGSGIVYGLRDINEDDYQYDRQASGSRKVKAD